MERTVKTIEESRLRQLYRTELRAAFPPAELKPFSAMEKLLRRGEYLPLGLFEGEELLSYALLWKSGDYWLLDYLGTVESRRGQGLGEELMRRLPEACAGSAGIYGEVELPQPGPQEAIQRRRLGFYARCGLVPAGYNCSLFGVAYQVLVLPMQPGAEDTEAVRRAHENLYRGHFPGWLYQRAIRLPLREGEEPSEVINWTEGP